MFASGETTLVLLSMILSNVSIVMGRLHWSLVEKDEFMPLYGKVLLTANGLLSLFTRMLALFLYFAPGNRSLLGLSFTVTLPIYL
jgi:hypothetical protein